jgi:hypothetical protein
VAILGPVGNYWWSGLPSNVWRDAWYQQPPQDQWAVWVAHHLPWLTYWWNTQKLFPPSSVIARSPLLLSEEDVMVRKKLGLRTYTVRIAWITHTAHLAAHFSALFVHRQLSRSRR